MPKSIYNNCDRSQVIDLGIPGCAGIRIHFVVKDKPLCQKNVMRWSERGRAPGCTFGRPRTYRDYAELVALCDLSQTRMDWYNQQIQERAELPPRPTYLAGDFDRMIAETKPDAVIVTTMDRTHHIYIIRAMELGCDVITEKPMTTDAEKLRAIFDAIDRTGRSLRVTFNYRYAPAYTALPRADHARA